MRKEYEAQLAPSPVARLWLLLALFTVLLPHLLRMPLLLSLGCVAVFAWRLAHELKGWALPRRSLRIALTLLAFLAVAALFRTVVGRDAGVALLSVMMCLKLLELRTLRDARVTLYLGYFLVIGGFLFSQSIYIGGYLLLVVLVLTAALIALNHPQATGSHTRTYLRYAGGLLLQSIPIMVALFLLFPRLNAPLWGMPQGAVSKTGLSDQIRMGTISSLVESEEVAFRVEFSGEIPGADQLYWRGPVLWDTDGRVWRRLQTLPALGNIPPFEPLSTTVEYTVTLEEGGNNWLFVLDLPSEMPRGLETPAVVLADYQLLSKRPITTKQRYSARSVLSYRDRATEARSWELRRALALPQGVNGRSVALAEGWRSEGLTAPQLVERGLEHFGANDFYYTRNPPLLASDPVDDFLFNTRRGFCEHYATAFVTLMRAAGVPARVVTGYQGGERNNLGNYLIVRQSSAHAWAEVWLEGEGWRRVDPTRNIPLSRIETPVDATRFATTDLLAGVAGGARFTLFERTFFQLRQVWDTMHYGWNMWVLGFDREQQERLLQALGIKGGDWKGMVILLVGTMIVLVLLISAAVLLRRPRHHDPVLRLYQNFCDKLAKAGCIRGPQEGPLDYARRACMALPERCDGINAVTQLYAALRYQRATPVELGALRKAVRDFSL